MLRFLVVKIVYTEAIFLISVLSAFTSLNLPDLIYLYKGLFLIFLNLCIIFHDKSLQLLNKFNIIYRAVSTQIKCAKLQLQ